MPVSKSLSPNRERLTLALSTVTDPGHVQIVLICTFAQAAGRRVVEVAAEEAVLEDGFSARR